LKRELISVVRLAVPVVAAQLGLILLGVVDTKMVGQVSEGALASVALGHTWYFGVMIFGLGLLNGLDPLIAQAHGAGEAPAARLWRHRGYVLAVIVAIPICLLLIPSERLFGIAGEPA